MASWNSKISFSVIATTTVLGLHVAPQAAAAPVAYVPYAGVHGGMGANTPDGVAVIDLSSNSVVTRIPISDPDRGVDPSGVAVTSDGSRAYVVGNAGAGPMSVIDTTTNAVIETVDLGDQLKGIATAPSGCRAYVITSREVGVLDLASNRLVAAVSPEGSSSFGDVTVSPDGQRAYVLDWFNRTVFVFDTAADAFVDTDPDQAGVNPIPLPGDPSPARLRLGPDGRRLYVAQPHGTTVSVVDTTTSRVIAEPEPFPSGSTSVAVSPDGGRVYVGGSAGDLHVMGSATLAPVQVLSDLAGQLVDLAVTPDGARVGVLNGTRGLLMMVDAATNAVITGVDVDGDPSSSGTPRAHAIGTPASGQPACPSPTTTTLAPTTTTLVPTTTTTTLPPAEACATARACLREVPWDMVCGQPINPKLRRAIVQTLRTALAMLEEAADESRAHRAARLALRARHGVRGIVRTAGDLLHVERNPVSADCRAEISQALQPGLQRIDQHRF